MIGTAARTAVIAGTATAVAGSVAGSQQRAAQQKAVAQQAQVDAAVQQALAQQAAPQQPALPSPVAAGGAAPDLIAQLQQLADMHKAGILSDVEFEAAKARLLSG